MNILFGNPFREANTTAINLLVSHLLHDRIRNGPGAYREVREDLRLTSGQVRKLQNSDCRLYVWRNERWVYDHINEEGLITERHREEVEERI